MKLTFIIILSAFTLLISSCTCTKTQQQDWYPTSINLDDKTVVARLPEIKAGKESGSISVESFKQIYEKVPDVIMMVDVRNHDVFKKGTFKNAINVPIDELIKREDEIVTDKMVIFFCGAGGIAGEAHDVMQVLRPTLITYFLNAEITFQKDGGYHLVEL